eukprot:gene9753-10750_t
MPSSSAVKTHENHLCYLAEKAKSNATQSGYLLMKVNDGTPKWMSRYFILHLNLLFEFHNQDSIKPCTVILLEQCKFERIGMKNIHDTENQFSFCIISPGIWLSLKAESENDCAVWFQKITQSSYALLQTKKEDFEHKYLHVMQVLESERAGRWQLLQQCQEQTQQLKDLRLEVANLRRRESQVTMAANEDVEDSEQVQKVKKVQSLFRGLLCRRRWHSIVQDYIRSPHAQSMRKRNQVVFELVRSEEDYLQTLSTLVTTFFRPIKMAASSKKPPLTHEEVNSIFLNIETLMFLHQIFLSGLQTRMESWPTLVLGDLFDMLLPMLSIYQEYVRNHHYSLQTLADCKQRDAFRRVLKMHEERPACAGRTLETFLTLPMYRIPNYIVTLHQLVALTPSDHVERKSLEHAQSVLEELSTVMQDEVSETENIRRNLSIERRFADGCEELLDVEQIFIRQGPLLQVGMDSQSNRRKSFSTLSLKSHDRKASIKQCFLFSRSMLLATRTLNGKLQIVPHGKIELRNTTLVEDVVDEDIDFLSTPSSSDSSSLVFKLIFNHPDESNSFKILFLAASPEDKASWTTDISQCIENLNSPETEASVSIESRQSLLSIRSDARLFTNDTDIKYSKALDSSRLPRIQYGSVDRLMERLLDVRFLSVEFLNTYLTTYQIFINAISLFDTLLQWYYTRAQFDYPACNQETDSDTQSIAPLRRQRNSCPNAMGALYHTDGRRRLQIQRNSVVPTTRDVKSPTCLYPPSILANRRHSSPSALYEEASFTFPNQRPMVTMTPTRKVSSNHYGLSIRTRSKSGPAVGRVNPSKSMMDFKSSDQQHFPQHQSQKQSYSLPDTPKSTDLLLNLALPPSCVTAVAAIVTGEQIAPDVGKTTSSPFNANEDGEGIPVLKLDSPPKTKKRDSKRGQSSDNAAAYSNQVGSSSSGEKSEMSLISVQHSAIDNQPHDGNDTHIISTVGVTVTPATSPISNSPPEGFKGFLREFSNDSASSRESYRFDNAPTAGTPTKDTISFEQNVTVKKRSGGRYETVFDAILSPSPPLTSPRSSPKTSPVTPPRSRSPQMSPKSPIRRFIPGSNSKSRKSSDKSEYITVDSGRTSPMDVLRSPTLPRSPNSSPPSPAPGVVVTSHRSSRRRSSISSAAVAFAAATAGASVSPAASPTSASRFRFGFNFQFSENVDGHIVTTRVVKILKHWISKQIEDFKGNDELRKKTVAFFKEVINDAESSEAEQKACNALLRTLQTDEDFEKLVAYKLILHPQSSERGKSNSPIADKISTLELAEQLTYINHSLLAMIPAREFLNASWMKDDKDIKTPNILRVINNFNFTSRLVSSDILSKQSASLRASAIERWAVVSDVCRCMHNFNGLLAIISAFTGSAVYRLKKTWEKVSKQTKILLEKLQSIVSAEGRFRNMREALRSCDPPCIPYLGFYLTDLAFIEEGTPNFNDSGLVNFSKMRMISNVIQEIRSYQQTQYKIKPDEKVNSLLGDKIDLVMSSPMDSKYLNSAPEINSPTRGLFLDESTVHSQDDVLELRRKISRMELEQAEREHDNNEQYKDLQSHVTKLRASVEKGEALRQKLEYELMLAQKATNHEKRKSAEKEFNLQRTVTNLKDKVGKLESDMEKKDQEMKTNKSEWEEERRKLKDILAHRQNHEIVQLKEFNQSLADGQRRIESTNNEQESKLNELVDKCKVLEGQRNSQNDTVRRLMKDVEFANDREERVRRELTSLQEKLKSADEGMESEHAAHLETKFSAEILQLKVRDLEGALEVEKASLSECKKKFESTTKDLRDTEAAFEEQRDAHIELKTLMDRKDKQFEFEIKELTRELNEKIKTERHLSEQIDVHQKDFDALKNELSEARKQQTEIQDMYGDNMKELELLLENFQINRNVGAKSKRQSPRSKMLSPAVVLENLRLTLRDYQSRLKNSSSELERLKKTIDDISSQCNTYKEMSWTRDKALEEARRLLKNSQKDTAKYKAECMKYENDLLEKDGESQKFSKKISDQRDRFQNLKFEHEKVKGDFEKNLEDTQSLLHSIYQQLVNGRVFIRSPREKTINSFSTAELGSMIQEQLTAKANALTTANKKYLLFTLVKVEDLEDLLKSRDDTLYKLERMYEDAMKKAVKKNKEREGSWKSQKLELENHYKLIVEDLQSRSEFSRMSLEEVWTKLTDAKQTKDDLEMEKLKLKESMHKLERDSRCLLVACALLCGALSSAACRVESLITEKRALVTSLRKTNELKEKITRLAYVLQLEMQGSSNNINVNNSSSKKSLKSPTRDQRRRETLLLPALLRFRKAVIAVLAVNRFRNNRLLLSDHLLFACKEWPTATKRHTLIYHGGRCDTDSEMSKENGAKNSPMEAYRRLSSGISWLSSPRLSSVVSKSMNKLVDKLDLFSNSTLEREDGTGPEKMIASVTSTARNAYCKMMQGVRSEFPSLHCNLTQWQHQDADFGDSLVYQLRLGLKRILVENRSSSISSESHTYMSSAVSRSDVMASLNQHILAFTQRLHSTELERRALRKDVARLSQIRDDMEKQLSTEKVVKENAASEELALRAKLGELEEKLEDRVHVQRYQAVCDDLSMALKREEQAQCLLEEQTKQMEEMGKRMELHSLKGEEKDSTLAETFRALASYKNDLKVRDDSMKKVQREISVLDGEKRIIEQNFNELQSRLQSISRERELLTAFVRSAGTVLEQSRFQAMLNSSDQFDFTLPELVMPSEVLAMEGLASSPDMRICQETVSLFFQAQRQALNQVAKLNTEKQQLVKRLDFLSHELQFHKEQVLQMKGSLRASLAASNCQQKDHRYASPPTANFNELMDTVRTAKDIPPYVNESSPRSGYVPLMVQPESFSYSSGAQATGK